MRSDTKLVDFKHYRKNNFCSPGPNASLNYIRKKQIPIYLQSDLNREVQLQFLEVSTSMWSTWPSPALVLLLSLIQDEPLKLKSSALLLLLCLLMRWNWWRRWCSWGYQAREREFVLN